MTTRKTNSAEKQMSSGAHDGGTARESRPRPVKLQAALVRAAHVYRETLYSSRSVAAIAFFVAAALAAGNHGRPASVMFGMLVLALLHAAPSGMMARYRFRSEIQRAALAEGFTPEEARRLAVEVFAEWSAIPQSVTVT